MPALLTDHTFWVNVFFAAEWAVRIAMIVVVPFRRSPEAAKGWLLLIFFEPAIGLALYLLIGRPTPPAWRLRRHVEFLELSKPVYERLGRDPNIFHPQLGPTLDHAVTLAENLGRLPILGGNTAEILADWKKYCPMFRKVMPVEYRRALAELKAFEAAEAAKPKLARA